MLLLFHKLGSGVLRKEETHMLKPNSIIIDPKKGNEFDRFIKENAKQPEFWNTVKKNASAPIDKKELDKLFEDKK